jgi:hypothetical protein
MGVVHRQHFIQWKSSQPLSLFLNNQCYPLASSPLDKQLSSEKYFIVKQIQTNLLYILTKIKSEKSTFVFKSLENKNHAGKNY